MRPLPAAVISVVVAASFAHSNTFAQDENGWQRLVLSEEFYSEGADFADFDGDGILDVVSGPFWYSGPDFRIRHAYTNLPSFAIAGYSEHFFSFAHDFNNDGHPDILAIPIPGAPGHWFENPGRQGQVWKKHLALDEVSNESPTFADVTGDNIPELVCIHKGAYGYASPDKDDPSQPWRFQAVSANRGYGRFTHGLGVGDVDGDGQIDLLEKDGWWQQSSAHDQMFTFHAMPFAASGGSQMFAYDFDGDGDNDVVSVQNAHGWGLNWFEQRGGPDNVGFIPHEILPGRYAPEASISLSQMHALALADIDGDGVKDIVTGKRFYAHGGRDPGALQLPALYWFRTVREAGQVRFEPRLIDARSGVGTQLTVKDCDGNGRPDILVGNKLGTFLFLNNGAEIKPKKLTPLLRGIGSPEYASTIRSTEPLSPEDEMATFVLPEGFEAQLVAAEPAIAKPMNMAFDLQERLWVTTSEEYPIAAPPNRPAKDRIVVLEDRDRDGHRETVTTFADGLNIPMGIYPYRDGVICFSIPDVLFLRDTDGDGRADHREKLYGPMGYERDTHGMVNAFTRGFDGWLYACHGFNNETTVAGTDGHQIKMQSGNTFRMRMDGSRVEHFTHGLVNPFGMAQSPDGDLFVADCHTKPISLLLPDGYYDSFGKPHDGLGYVPNVMDHLHGSTAIGGIVQYNSNGFPTCYQGNCFGGNVMTGRVNRNSLQPVGSGFRAREEPDFLICGDPWFRPVDLQLGPDGAIYVADFYNRIIGHYEVGLDHPGRDRHRGRIWKIVYTGSDGRRDFSAPQKPAGSSPSTDPETTLFQQLASPNMTQRMLATDALSDIAPADVADNVASLLADKSASVRVHALWVLHRRGMLTDDQLNAAFEDTSGLVRTHAFRILREQSTAAPDTVSLLRRGFADSSPIVRRAAVHAAARHPNSLLVEPLLSLYHQSPASDAHLRHSIRMALRDHLSDTDTFRQAAANSRPEDVHFFAGICLALNTKEAGEFLVDHLPELADVDAETFAAYVQFAVRHVSAENVAVVTKVARDRFQDDREFQITLLDAAREGLSQRGADLPTPLKQWAGQIAADLLQLNDGRLPPDHGRSIPWTFSPLAAHPGESDIFAVSATRRSADGMEKTPLISSYTKGEQRTGTFTSGTFELPDRFHFYMAGHHGFPGEKPHQKNLVRLRDAKTHEILQTWYPPRNDTAQKFDLDVETTSARVVYVEIIDGDNANAYAWLAVGRFSVQGLNPNGQSQNDLKAVDLIARFKLGDFQPILAELLRRNIDAPANAGQVAKALTSIQPRSAQQALAAAVAVAGLTPQQREQFVPAIVGPSEDGPKLLETAFRVATAREQGDIADVLCSERAGVNLLFTFAENGIAAPSLLRRPRIADAIRAVVDEKLLARLEKLVVGLPTFAEDIEQRIADRTDRFRKASGNAVNGEMLFTRNCAVCHQVAGKGKKVGPNLDGIGIRGLDRLIEDILAPSRNVDVAFRATTVLKTDGKTISGLSKGLDGARLVLINSKGEQISIPEGEIEDQVTSRRSPMPDNIDEILTEEQFRDLVAWLLTLRS